MSGDGNNQDGARLDAGRSVIPRSVSMRPEMWAMIDEKRGSSSRGVFLPPACIEDSTPNMAIANHRRDGYHPVSPLKG
jgi:hypothetical protein